MMSSLYEIRRMNVVGSTTARGVLSPSTLQTAQGPFPKHQKFQFTPIDRWVILADRNNGTKRLSFQEPLFDGVALCKRDGVALCKRDGVALCKRSCYHISAL